MRKFCLDCTIKHLGQAYVLHGEVEQGYPEHILGVIGHLAEASEECIGASKELADKIRQYRLIIHENLDMIVKGEEIVDIPYFELFNATMEVMREKGCGSCQKAKKSFKDRLKQSKKENEEVQ